MPIYQIDGIKPVISPRAFVHPTAVVIGDVIIEDNCYIGPCAVLRGDFGPIRINNNANIQDTCVMHGFPGIVTLVEEYGHVGHGAVVHGCIIGKNVLVGMNAVIMDESVIGAGSIVGAMSFVKAEAAFPERSLIVGSPAKVIREVSEDELKWKRQGTEVYIELAKRSQETMIETTALSEPEPGRAAFEIDYKTLSQVKKK